MVKIELGGKHRGSISGQTHTSRTVSRPRLFCITLTLLTLLALKVDTDSLIQDAPLPHAVQVKLPPSPMYRKLGTLRQVPQLASVALISYICDPA